MRNPVAWVLAAGIVSGWVAGPASGQVGEPLGFEITLRHGSVVIAQEAVSIGPGGDLEDIKVSDGDPEDFMQIGTLGTGPDETPIIMKVVTEDDPLFRLLHIYIDAPIDLSNIGMPGPNSLFDPSRPEPIDVTVTNMTFEGTTFATPMLLNSASFFVSYMRDAWGRFYELPQANAFDSFGNGVNDIQVPGSAFLDADPSEYEYLSSPGAAVEWSWSQMPNPGPTTTVHDGTSGGQPSAGNGHVFELGLGVAFVGVPEPTTLGLLLVGLAMSRRRRCQRHRRAGKKQPFEPSDAGD